MNIEKPRETPKTLVWKLVAQIVKPTTGADGDSLRRGEMASGEPWTDEKHLRYLNSMEASFVRTMLETKSLRLRLDRYLPDTSDSTLDLKSHKTKTKNKHRFSSGYTGLKNRMDGRSEKRSRRIMSSQPLNSSQDDQVVPQLENRSGGDKVDKIVTTRMYL